MSPTSTFDRLVRQLHPDERRALRSKIAHKDELTFSHSPEPEERTLPDYSVIMKTYSWWKRLLLFFKSLFGGVSIQDTVKAQVFIDLGSDLENQFPNWLNSRTRVFYPHFYHELKRVLDAFRFFKTPLSLAFGQEKGDFFAFLIGSAMEEIQQRILIETDHWMIYESNPERPSNEIKTIVEGNLRVILDSIPQDIRRNVYLEVKKIHYLQLAVDFPADSLLGPFLVTGETPAPIPIDEVAESLVSLWSRLAALDDLDLQPPLESLFLFQMKVQRVKNDELEKHLEDAMTRSTEALEVIREFRSRVPLFKFCALATRNIEVRKDALPGIEDWYSVYRQFWRNKIVKDYHAFNRERSQKMLLSTVCHFLDLTEKEFEDQRVYPKIMTNEVYPAQNKTITFLKLFYQRTFHNRFHPLLKMIFIDGEFYKKSNKAEYNDSFAAINRFSDDVEVLVKRLSTTGDLGGRLLKIGSLDPDAQIPEVKAVIQTAAEQTQDLVRKMTPVLQSLYNLLHGIVKPETGGVYDTLTNIASLGGKNNLVVRKELISLSSRTDLLLKILLQLVELETV